MNFRPNHLVPVLLFSVTCLAPLARSQEIGNEEELRAQLETAKSFLGHTADRGAVLFLIAATHALLNEPHAAMVNLKECIELKEGFDPIGEPAFAGLRESKDFQTL